MGDKEKQALSWRDATGYIAEAFFDDAVGRTCVLCYFQRRVDIETRPARYSLSRGPWKGKPSTTNCTSPKLYAPHVLNPSDDEFLVI
eukprot:1429791-Rhodomonas_salina.2